MKEILERGKTTKAISTCNNCGCKFVFEESALDYEYESSKGLYSYIYKRYYVTCPNCGKKVYQFKEYIKNDVNNN